MKEHHLHMAVPAMHASSCREQRAERPLCLGQELKVPDPNGRPDYVKHEDYYTSCCFFHSKMMS